ncbi:MULTISPECIES: extracellular solute-binding protein [unclassified Micromonospora]|uniref:extracellular solute-binding protein n=1 Tax=unclassified Micromonospora TaxID=2617518 RepID=UPI0022C0CFDF|nr:extracellular solute-binding protein [Micromonospora sp. AKA38]GHJ15922.1 sugar ABC transporter substrate-binding protein [Micromonospora sp. AKA38]
MRHLTPTRLRLTAVGAILALAAGGCANGGGPGGSSAGTKAKAASFCDKQQADPTGAATLTPDPNLKADLTFWGWYNIVPKSVLDDFNKIYPNVRITFTDFSTSDTHTKLATALAGGAGAPDMSMIQDRDAPRFHSLPLYDLTNCLKPYEKSFPSFKWDKIKRPSGQLQAVPWEADAAIVAYRTDLFAKYGIDAAAISTWDDYIAAGKKIDQASGGKTKMVMSLPVANDNGIAGHIMSDFNMLLNEESGQYFGTDGTVEVNSDKGLAALQMIKRFRDENITLNDLSSGKAEQQAFQGDKVATILQQASVSFALNGALKDQSGKWGVMQLPAFTAGGNRGAIRGGTSLAITTQSKNPEAAWKFLQFWLMRVDSRWESYQVGKLVENLFLPAAQDQRFNQGDPYFTNQPFLKTVITSAEAAPVFNENLKTNQLESAFKTRLRDFLAGKVDAKTMLDQVADDTKKAQ